MFDYDGVLVDSLDVFHEAFCESCRAQGFEGFEVMQRFLRIFDTNMFDGMIAAGFPPDRIQGVLAPLKSRIDARQEQIRFFSGMEAILTRLAHEHTVYIISSNLSSSIEDSLKRNGIERIREVLGSDKEPSKVAKIRATVARHPGLTPYYIGDTLGDMLEGRAAAAKTVAVGWGWHSTEHLLQAQPDHVMQGMEDLIALFRDA